MTTKEILLGFWTHFCVAFLEKKHRLDTMASYCELGASVFLHFRIAKSGIQARKSAYKIQDITNFILRIIDCSLYTRHFALEED